MFSGGGTIEVMYVYTGPAELTALAHPESGGARINTPSDMESWSSAQSPEDLAAPFTYVVDRQTRLRLAPRRSEHVVCASGEPVLGAGEITFDRDAGRWTVAEITNLSTGYCPDVTSWDAVARSLERAGLGHPGGFTHEVVFRRCVACREVNVVREGDFVCVFCDAPLPREWNAGPVTPS